MFGSYKEHGKIKKRSRQVVWEWRERGRKGKKETEGTGWGWGTERD